MQEQVHKVISIKDVSITLDNDRIHIYVQCSALQTMHYTHPNKVAVCYSKLIHSCCRDLTAQPVTNTVDWAIWVIVAIIIIYSSLMDTH